MARKNKDSDTNKSGPPDRKAALAAVMATLAGPGAFLRRAWGKFNRTPRVFKVAAVYFLTVLAVIGLYIWRASSLHLQFPYSSMEELPDRYEYQWENETLPQQESPSDPGAEPEVEQAEMVHAAQPTPAAEVPAAEAVQGPAGGNPPALWPAEGELRHVFWDPVSVPLVPPNSQYRYSRGVSIQTAPGTAVRAVWGGVVRRVSDIDYPYGASVTISHAGGLESYYGALQNVQVSAGDSVRQGQVLGQVAPGDGGEPALLYLEIRDHHTAVDPLLYLSGK